MKNILNLVKKELDKVFRNPRAILVNFLLPGILIFVVYSLMGTIMADTQSDLTKANYKIAVVNPSTNFSTTFDGINSGDNKLNFTFETISDVNVEDFSRLSVYDKLTDATEEETAIYNRIMNSVNNSEYDVWLCFNSNFDSCYENNNTESNVTAGVFIFAKSTIDKSSFASSTLSGVLNAMLSKYMVIGKVDFSTDSDVTQSFMATIIPLFLMVFIFAGGMPLGADSIAGEKERGTIATLLMTPIKRSYIITGKIISLVVLTLVSALGPFLAMILSFPKMMKNMGVELSGGIGLTASAAFEILLLIVLTALLAVAIFLLISTIAKNIKEANVFATPIYMLITILSVVSTTVKLGNNIGLYFVPFLNITLGLQQAITGTLTGLQLTTIALSSLAYFVIILAIAVKLFNSEKVMFSK